MQKTIKEKTKQLRGNFTCTIRDTKTNKIKRVYEYKNLVVTVGRAVIAERLAQINTNSLNIDFAELGTGTTAPANGDTALETPVFRKATSSATSATKQAFLSFFFTALEVSGTFREIATWIDGSITIGTGVMFSRVGVNITKSLSETLTIDVQYDIN